MEEMKLLAHTLPTAQTRYTLSPIEAMGQGSSAAFDTHQTCFVVVAPVWRQSKQHCSDCSAKNAWTLFFAGSARSVQEGPVLSAEVLLACRALTRTRINAVFRMRSFCRRPESSCREWILENRFRSECVAHCSAHFPAQGIMIRPSRRRRR